MNSDGSNVTRLTKDDEVAFYNPEWSPDGRMLVFYAEKGDAKDQIWTINADGTSPRLLTNNIGHNIFPAFSPNGKKIIYSSNLGGEHGGVFTMNLDGTEVEQLKGIKTGWIRYSPDGKKIVYVEGRFPNSSIIIANADGSNPKKIVGD